jgi:hypothetical protein
MNGKVRADKKKPAERVLWKMKKTTRTHYYIGFFVWICICKKKAINVQKVQYFDIYLLQCALSAFIMLT